MSKTDNKQQERCPLGAFTTRTVDYDRCNVESELPICRSDCAWYDRANECCLIRTFIENWH